MGVHHAWGRDLQGPLPALPRDARRGPALPERLRLPGPVGRGQRRARPRLHRASATSRRYGIAEFVTLCKQRVLTYAARQTEQSIRLGMWMDWNDPRRAAPPARPARPPTRPRSTTIEGPDGPVTDTVEMLVGRLGMPDIGGSYFTFSNENNDLIWGFLAECHRRGWLYKGHDTMPWCARCGTGHLPDGDERGLPGPRGPGPDGPLPAASTGPASRSSSGRRRPGR